MASAALFGASTPLAKLLLGDGLDPWLLAGLLYAGSGLGLGLFYLGRYLRGGPIGEAKLQRSDLPWLGPVVLSGGVLGPLLLMLGLARTSASSAALLLNVEGLATMGIAWVVFRESVDRRLLLGALAILTGAVLLSWQGQAGGIGYRRPGDRRRLHRLGRRQQSDPQIVVCRSGPNRDDQRSRSWGGQPVASTSPRRHISRDSVGRRRGHHRIGRLRDQPGAVCSGLEEPRISAHRSVFLDGPFHRRIGCDCGARRSRHRQADRGGRSDEHRRLFSCR